MKKLYRHPVPTLAIRAIAFAATAACTGAHAASLPTHCRAGEVAYLNAHMAEIHPSAKPRGGWKPGDTLYQLNKTGKLVSICADSASEPPRAIAYRYGPAGKVEMEHVASASHPFSFFDRSTSPHTGEEVLFFAAGPYTYCVTAATGQGQGIGVTVLKGGRKMLDLFSGTERDKDYEGGLDRLFDIDVASKESPLRAFNKTRSSRTPCDTK